MAIKDRVIELIYDLKDRFTKKVGQITSSMRRVSDASAQSANKIERSNTRAAGSFSKIGVGAKGAALAVAAAIGAVISQISQWTRAAAVQERAETKLATTLTNLTGATQEQINALKAQAAALQQVTGYGDEQTISAQAMLGTFRLNAEQIQQLTPRLLDMAEASRKAGNENVDLETISIALGKAFTSGIGSLSRYGVAMTDAQKEAFKLADQQEKVRILTEVLDGNFKGLAAAVGDTYEGALRKSDAAQGDFYETLGNLFTKNKAFIKLQELFKKTWDDLSAGIGGASKEIGAAISVLAAIFTHSFNGIKITWNAFQIAFKTGALAITKSLALITKGLSFVTFGDLSAELKQTASDLDKYGDELSAGISEDFSDIGDAVKSTAAAFGAIGDAQVDKSPLAGVADKAAADADKLKRLKSDVDATFNQPVNTDGLAASADLASEAISHTADQVKNLQIVAESGSIDIDVGKVDVSAALQQAQAALNANPLKAKVNAFVDVNEMRQQIQQAVDAAVARAVSRAIEQRGGK